MQDLETDADSEKDDDPSERMEDMMEKMHEQATTQTGHLGEHPCCTQMDYRIPPR